MPQPLAPCSLHSESIHMGTSQAIPRVKEDTFICRAYHADLDDELGVKMSSLMSHLLMLMTVAGLEAAADRLLRCM